jgi:hypothetical protein
MPRLVATARRQKRKRGRPRGSGNVTAIEALEIRRMFAAGVRVADIVRRTGRGESVVYRLTRGMQRKRPPPPKGRHAARNDRILVLIEKGWSQARVAEEFGLSPSALHYVVRTHPRLVQLLRSKRARIAHVARKYRLELSTALRIANNGRPASRTRSGSWD